jgi:hypothetical protein
MLMLHQTDNIKVTYTTVHFGKLLSWLEASGEFNEEVQNLRAWEQFLKDISVQQAETLLERASDFAWYFEVFGRKYLGSYTTNIDDFLSTQPAKYRFREDRIFTGRTETEYFFNVFAAEIINRKLKAAFDATTEKVILLPTCMSKPLNGNCKAEKTGNRMICKGCSAQCPISKIKREMESDQVSVNLIPHSSDFSAYLKYWRDQKTTGLVGVACILNLLSGGQQMQNLNIPSQCVFLNFSGCKKHWDSEGIPTEINIDQLRKTMEMSISVY